MRTEEWQGSAWITCNSLSVPTPRYAFAAAYSPQPGGILLFGGTSGGAVLGDTWLRNGPHVPASFTAFGVGCSGTGGVPALSNANGSLPWIGGAFSMELSNLPPSIFGLAIGATGFSRTQWQQYPLPHDLGMFGMPGCSAFVDPAISQGLPSFGGHATWQVALPNVAAFVGMSVYSQGMVLDLGANAANFIVSNAAGWVIGRQ